MVRPTSQRWQCVRSAFAAAAMGAVALMSAALHALGRAGEVWGAESSVDRLMMVPTR